MTRPSDWDWEANANCPQILPYAQEIRGKSRSRQWSSRDQKWTKKLLAPGLRPGSNWGAYSAPPHSP